MLPQASFASSSRSVPNLIQQNHRPGPKPQTLNRRIAFNMESIKISNQQGLSETDSEETTVIENPVQATIENPVQSMFLRHQQRSKDQGRQRLSYPREYKLAAIELVKGGKTR